MGKEERKYISQTCYVSLTSKPNLFNANEGKCIQLSATEYKILSYFIDNANDPVYLDELAKHIWGINYGADDRHADSLKSQISRIRKKLEEVQPGLQKCLETNYGLGSYTLKLGAISANARKVNDNISLIADFSRDSGNPEKVFVPPTYFIPPSASITHLLNHAFVDSNVHVISGQRGMGKTELARYYAHVCCNDSDIREELKYNNIIFTTYSEQGLGHTISLLRCNDCTIEGNSYSQKIRFLKEMKKPCLLIIDNYDNEESYLSELSATSNAYIDLINTGCHILFTSKVNTNGCFAVRQTEISSLPSSNLVNLFRSLSQNIDFTNDMPKILILIERFLLSNTYLVILAAKLTSTKSLDEILAAFQAMTVNDISDPVSVEKDGAKQMPLSLMNHYKVMFNLAGAQQDTNKKHLLTNLALLPLDGMNYDEFFAYAFDSKKIAEMKMAFAQLHDSFWVFLRNKTVFLHPLIKEMVLSQPFDISVIAKMIASINQLIHIERYTMGMEENLKLAVSAYEVCKKCYFKNAAVAMLVSNITSNYDTLKNSSMAYDYGKKALELLNDVECSSEGLDQAALAAGYNMVGYAVLHAYNRDDSRDLAEKALNVARSLIENVIKDGKEDVNADILRTKIQGNLAALYIRKRDYDKALDLHSEAKTFRQELLEKMPSPEIKLLLAAAYKGIATDYYYLSKKETHCEGMQELLDKSLQNHRQATSLYEEVQPKMNLDSVIANNRLVSTGISLLKLEDGHMDAEQSQELIHEFIERMRDAAQCLCSIEPVVSEIEICITNVSTLIELMMRNNLYEKIDLEIANQIAELIMQVKCEEIEKWQCYFQTIVNVKPGGMRK